MAAMAWILSLGCLFGGLAVYQAPFFPHADLIMKGLFAAAFLICPGICGKNGLLGFAGVTRGQRVAACLAGLLALPALYF